MNAIVLIVIGLGAFTVGYMLYSKFIAERVFKLDSQFETPAHEFEDGVDFVPTNKYILWGHHFTSVAGLAPIVGPAVAVIWGWVPAFIWVVLGTIFFAGVHDAGALWASVRNRARSIGALTDDIVGGRARAVFMVVIFLLLLMVNAVFAIIIADLFVSVPSSVFPAWIVIAVALVMGWLLYRKGVGLLIPSIVALVVLYGSIFLGNSLQVEMPAQVMGLAPSAQWVVILFIYASIASVLPVWLLLQPRDYVNSLQLFIGLAIVYGAVMLSGPTIVAPAFNGAVPEGTPSLVPLLFVTIACGAVSGFHGLVSSGTTSKQLNSEMDVRFVGYLGAVGEGALALAAILATTAGFATLAEWEGLYGAWTPDGVGAWVTGGGALVSNGLGFPVAFSENLLAVMAVLFGATTMDTGVRLQRYIVQEWGAIYKLDFLTGRYLSTLVAVGCCIALAFGAGGAEGTGGLLIWPLFGTTNQLLAALTLLVLSVALLRLGRPVIYTLGPLVFLLVMATLALLAQLRTFYDQGNWFLIVTDVLILAATIWVALEALGALRNARGGGEETPEDVFSAVGDPGER